MRSRIKSVLRVFGVLIVCGYAVVAAADARAFEIFRSVAHNNNGVATLSPSQFSFNAGPLSTFDWAHRPNSNCYVEFRVQNLPNDPPQANDAGTVQGLAGYTATFDNNPAGHWSITRPGGTSAAQARIDVSNYARGDVANNVVNNSQNDPNCQG